MRLLASLLFALFVTQAVAQSPGGFVQGQTLNAADLNNAFAAKQNFPVTSIPGVLSITGPLTIGTAGTSGSITFNGSISGSSSLAVNPAGIFTSLALAGPLTIGGVGIGNGTVSLGGNTSGSSTLSVNATGSLLTSSVDFSANDLIGTQAGATFVAIRDSSQSANNKNWDFQASGGQLNGRVVNDALNVSANWINVTRGGATVSAVNFPAGNTNFGGVGTGSGQIQLFGNTSGSIAFTTNVTGGHVALLGSSTPTVSACAGFALTGQSNDTMGRVTLTSATSCAISFGTAYNNAPQCIVVPGSAASTVEAVTTTTTLTATFGTAQTAFQYLCFGT